MIKACVTRESGCCQCLDANELDVEQCPDCILGDQITNNLVTDQLVAESLGRAKLDEEHKNKRRVSGSCSLHEYMKPKSLVEMKQGQEGTVVTIIGGRFLCQRLGGMCIRPGEKIRKMSKSFLGGPVTLRIGRTRVAIGCRMASKIILEVEENI